MPAVICRSLRREYRLQAASAELYEALRFMETKPELPQLQLEMVDIPVAAVEGFCIATWPDGTLVQGSADHVISMMHGQTQHDAEVFDPAAPFIHGATVLVGGKRLLLVGPKGAGKTTLTLHLVARGHRVEGDEHLLVLAGAVMARPRTLRIKPGTLALLPAVRERGAIAPTITAWDGTRICALSPAVMGGDWTIRHGPLDAIVFLTPNHGGRSFADRVGREDAFRRLVPEVVRWPAAVAAGSARLWQLLASSRQFELILGDLDGAEWHLERIAALDAAGG